METKEDERHKPALQQKTADDDNDDEGIPQKCLVAVADTV